MLDNTVLNLIDDSSMLTNTGQNCLPLYFSKYAYI